MPNKGRGEVEFEAGGRTYLLRPSFETMSAIETELDMSGSELMRMSQQDPSKPKMTQMMTVVYLAVKGTKENKKVPSISRLGESMRSELGVTGITHVAMSFLVNSILSDAQREKIEAEFDDEETKDADPSRPSQEIEEPSQRQ